MGIRSTVIQRNRKKKNNEQALDAFLRESCSPEEAKQYIQDVQKKNLNTMQVWAPF
jgi:hypothetical protein